VAVKMILRGELASLDDRQRFRSEAEAAARLDHPGIVPVYEVGEHDGRPYFNMKYVAGRTLAQVLAEGPMPPREAARILAGVARAIHFAHRQGLLHRDLKPSNILIDDEGNPHVTDFGLAKRTTGAASLTRTGAVLGTPAYMAPEQARGDLQAVDERSDVFALGAILYFLLTGRAPIDRAMLESFRAGEDVRIRPPRGVRPSIPRAVEAICVKALATHPSHRYASVAELRADITNTLNEDAVSAYRERPWAWAWRLAWKYRTALLIVGTYVAVRILLIFISSE
jgi:serine/threonine-protein kinase